MLDPDKTQESCLSKLKTPITLASKSEGACLFALNKYCNFVPDMGINMQVPLDRCRRADFKIDSTYIEYHPIVLQREFDSKHAQYRFNKTVNKLPDWARHEITGIMLNEFSVRYYNQRKMLIDVKHKGQCDLIVAGGSEEFYDSVIKRFGSTVPTRKTFLREFDYHRSDAGFKTILEQFGAIKV
jgi:hypothetical protein